MKRLVICLCFIVGIVLNNGIIAQNNDTIVKKPIDNPMPINGAKSIDMDKWKNSIDPFVGVWTLEKTILDTGSDTNDICAGTFMVINPDATYSIFVYFEEGTYITSQGIILVDSPNEYIEVISHHMNKSLIGISNRINYKIDFNYLYKSFWIGKDKYGDEFNRQVDETWKRAKIPKVGEFENNPAFPI